MSDNRSTRLRLLVALAAPAAMLFLGTASALPRLVPLGAEPASGLVAEIAGRGRGHGTRFADEHRMQLGAARERVRKHVRNKPKDGGGQANGGSGDKPRKGPRPRDHAETKPPPKHEHQHERPHVHRIACIGGRVHDGACACRGGTPARRIGHAGGTVKRFVCAPVFAAHPRPILPLAAGIAAAAGGTAVAAAPPARPPVLPPPTTREPRRDAPPASAIADEARPGEVLFWIDNDLPESTEARIARRERLQILSRTRSALIGKRFVHARVRDGRPVAEVVDALAATRTVAVPQPNYVYRQQQQSPPATGAAAPLLQYALERLDLPLARRTATGRGAVVAVIDTGIDRAHPDLAAADIRELDTAGLPRSDDRAHGTALAGIIAGHGITEGVAPAARILAVRAFAGSDAGPVGTTVSVLQALEVAIAERARILNLSFAGPRDPALEKALAGAAARDVILVAAAGNAGHDAPPAYPAAYPDVIAVTATDADDRLYVRSNTGGYVAIAAPGVDVLAPAPGGAHDLKTGTSFAAAHVSGVIALMLEQNPRLSPRAARRNLAAGALDLGAPGVDEEYGAGRANAAASLNVGMTQAAR